MRNTKNNKLVSQNNKKLNILRHYIMLRKLLFFFEILTHYFQILSK